ncbi:MAG: HAD family phosphatase [Clostridia bacterium]|nr:HAD family phosphatase [Clostridia bacterium]
MPYKMLCLNLDDTLLERDLTIPPQVQTALRELTAGGVLVTLATGRMFPSAARYARLLGLSAPLVVYNGAVVQAIDSKPLFSRSLPVELLCRLAAFCRQKNWYLQLYNDDVIVVDTCVEETRIDPDLAVAGCREVGDLTLAPLGPSPKAMTAGDPSVMAERLTLLRQAFGEELSIAASKPYLLEMMMKGVTKAQSLALLAQHHGIAASETVAVGDSSNDAEMIRWAGVGCCVANGLDTLKAQADYLCTGERSNGVLEVIRRFF